MNEKQEAFWIKFKENNPELKNITFGSAWCFGDSTEMANELAKLVLKGDKTATASAFVQYKANNEPLPKVNKEVFDILLDGEENPIAILENIKVYVTTFDKVTDEHAYKEGEGDKSLTYWKKVHYDFWAQIFDFENIKNVDIEKMKVVCEEFRVVWNDK